MGLEQEYKKIRGGSNTEGGINLSIITGRDVTQVAKGCSLQERKQRLEEEKRRLMELKKEADNLWLKVKKQQEGSESGESDSDKEKQGVAEGAPEGGAGQESRPRAKSAKTGPGELDDSKFKELERALAMERKRRQDMEKLLSEKQKQEELDRIAALEKAKKEMMTEKAIQERLSAKVMTRRYSTPDMNNVAQASKLQRELSTHTYTHHRTRYAHATQPRTHSMNACKQQKTCTLHSATQLLKLATEPRELSAHTHMQHRNYSLAQNIQGHTPYLPAHTTQGVHIPEQAITLVYKNSWHTIRAPQYKQVHTSTH